MTRYDRRLRSLAACLSAVAGFVDAVAFIHLGGFFVSFMSGNTTRLGVGLAENGWAAAVAASLIVAFVVGVIAGSTIGHAAKEHRRPAVLLFVALALASAAALGALGFGAEATLLMALAMGAENAVFESDGEVHIGLTYMTGTLVKMGQRIATAFRGGDALAWTPYFSLWIGLAAGAFAGALAYPRIGLESLWIAAAATVALALAARRIERLA